MLDEKGKPVPFASIAIRDAAGGSTVTGVSADASGAFSINARNAQFLVISSAGFSPKEVALTKESNNLRVQLGTTTQVIEEVVVTALGVRRNKNQLPYAAQQIGGEAVSQARGNNLF